MKCNSGYSGLVQLFSQLNTWPVQNPANQNRIPTKSCRDYIIRVKLN